MEIQGKIFKVMPVQTGQGKNGTWKKQEFILETEGQIQRKICFSLWGDKTDQLTAGPGETITVFFDLESREFNDRWYTDAKAWKITRGEGGKNAPASSAYKAPQDIPASDDFSSSQEDDLPF